jgi:hypothetical protein
VIYNFWERGGNPGFRIFNKTDKNVYVDLSSSFFIHNNRAFDYYRGREFNVQNSISVSKSASASASAAVVLYGMLGYYDASAGKSVSYGNSVGINGVESQGMTFHEKPVVCIPPHSEKYFSEYSILESIVRFCEIKQDYPKSASEASLYQRDNSPVVFKNIISYFVDNKEDVKLIENEFWISEIINYTYRKATIEDVTKECEYDYGTLTTSFSVSAPDKFYNTYKNPKSR